MIFYRERLWPTHWLPLILALVIPLLWLVIAPFNSALGFAVGGFVFAVLMIAVYARVPVVTVTESTFTYGRAEIELSYVGSVSAFSGAPALEQRRTKLDARAWIALRPLGDGLVKLEIVDDADPTPYWLVSTRDPKGLASALRTARENYTG